MKSEQEKLVVKSPCFQFYPSKWLADTRRLSWLAKGVYHELLCVLWTQFQDSCAIPDDDNFICAELGIEKDVWLNAKAEIMHPLRPLLRQTETNWLFSPGLMKEAEKQAERREMLRQNGSRGGRPKKPKGNQDESLLSLPLPLVSNPLPSLPYKENVTRLQKAKGTLIQVEEFCKSEGLKKSDAVWFYHKCEGNGWRNGKNQIKDWRATIRSWKAAGYMASQKSGETSIYPITDCRNPAHPKYNCAP